MDDQEAPVYSWIQDTPALGGQQYPLLQGLAWKIRSTKLGPKAALKVLMRDRDGVVFRWVKDSKVLDLYVAGLNNADDLLRKLHLSVNLDKGAFVLSKRWSRIFRPYFYWMLTPASKVNIQYVAEWDTKAWDGAGLVSRKFLARLCKNLPPDRERALRTALTSCGRVELTVLSAKGEDKCHALVVDDLPCDLMLPQDTKQELKRTDRQVFIGANPVHSRNHMWVDIQSLINLHPFLPTHWLLNNLEAHGQAFLKAIESGQLDEPLAEIHDLGQAEDWPIKDYLASGGHAMWFSGVIRQIANQHLQMVTKRSKTRLRTPVPGGRYYVFNSIVGQREIPEGMIELDETNATAWVNRNDWAAFASIWGGADQDDALWVLPFHDHDGSLKVMGWRSPNQLGEYVLLTPTDTMVEACTWATWPELDSRLLTPRIDQAQVTYLGLIQKTPLTKGRHYTISAMTDAVKAAAANIGEPGMSINLQLLLKATTGQLPDERPASLEDILDACVKTGDSVLQVKNWVKTYARMWFLAHPRVPLCLHDRLLKMLKPDQREYIQPTLDHWLDVYIAGIQKHLHSYAKQRDLLCQQAFPPLEVLVYGQHHIPQGMRVREAYNGVMRPILGKQAPSEADFDRARDASEQAIKEYPVSEWTHVLAGIVTRGYVVGDDNHISSDAVIWQFGRKDNNGRRKRGIVHVTLKMLRECGVIDELIEVEGQVLHYNGTTVQHHTVVNIKGPWFAYHSFDRTRQGLSPASAMGKVSYADRTLWKGFVQQRAESDYYVGKSYLARWEGDRKLIYTEAGQLLGYVQRGHEDTIADELIPKLTVAIDGNLLCVVEDKRETV